MVQKLKNVLYDLRVYWNLPMPGRYMTFKEIIAYAGGGIGAYFIITMCSQLVISTNNLIVGDAIGISPTHMYVLYIIATLANIPLTAVRASMVDNSRNKAGKYRPFLISMGIPSVLVALGYVWFPYESLYTLFTGEMFGFDSGYVVKLIVVLIFNLLLQFFFNFFNDAYTNLIHVLSPNTQERTDVLSIKSVVYSLAPSIMNIVTPLVAQHFTNDDMYDIRLYRITYPIFAVLGMALTVIVFGYTKEKIIQPKTRAIQVRFIDSFKSVAKNKYFWIIALAGWLGFLEGAYSNILSWTYTYGHACEGSTMSIINTVVGNASMWGMIIAPFCVRAFGKKKVLLGVNFMNVVCILAMGLNTKSMIWLAVCVYFNWLFGAFEQITTPAIQADIRDYQHYISGVRVDGMFATVQTIGNIVTLVTSAVLPFVYESYGIYEGNGYESPYEILDVTTGQPGLLSKVIIALVLMAAAGAFLNMVPYFFYDLTEKQQKGIVRVLKIRAMFEDYGNGVTNNKTLVEAIDIINESTALAEKETTEITAELKRNTDKRTLKEIKKANEEIEIARFVCDELEKFRKNPSVIAHYNASREVYNAGIDGLYNLDKAAILDELMQARKLPKGTAQEKEMRKYAVEIAQAKLASRKAIDKYFKSREDLVAPDFSKLDALFDEEEAIETKLRQLYIEQADAKKEKDTLRVQEATSALKELKTKKKELAKLIEAEKEKHTFFARAAKAYIDAERIIKQKENYEHLEELAAKYEEAKAAEEAARQAALDEQKRLDDEKEKIKAEKIIAKKNKK